MAVAAREAVEVRARAAIAPLLGMGAVGRKLHDSLSSNNPTSMSELNVGGRDLGSEEMRMLSNALRNGAAPQLAILNVSSNNIGADDF